MSKELKMLKKDIIKSAKAHNKFLTDSYLRWFSIFKLINFSHPDDRSNFFRRYLKAKENEEKNKNK